MQQINILIENYLSKLYIPSMHWSDVAEILIIAFLMYYILLWIKNTRAWALLKGVLVIAVFVFVAVIFKMNTILWIVSNLFSIAAIAIVVILQPELRKAIEELGRKNFFSSIITFDASKSAPSPHIPARRPRTWLLLTLVFLWYWRQEASAWLSSAFRR